ncbi:tetratricopeptide repeat protein [Candidatus Bipolaricaulota bacterium]|nr:tetratricopeptide repeat protein [Candidatus Bipolaricaulota bacterium]
MSNLEEFIQNKNWKFEFGLREVRLTLLLGFALTMPLVIYLGNTEYGYTKTIYTFAYISFLTLFWLVELFLDEEKTVSLTQLSLPVGLLLISGLLSLINATSKGVVLQSLALLVYFYLIYLIVANTIRTRKEVIYFLVALTTSGFGATLYGTLQYLGVLRGPHGFAARPGSIISVMGNQNYLGGFVSYLFIPVVALVLTVDSKAIKAYLIVCLGIFFFLLFPIGARGAWLSLVIASIIFVSLLLYYKPIKNLRGMGTALFVILIVLLVAYLFASAPGPLNSVLSYSASEAGQNRGGFLARVFRPIIRELVQEGGARAEDWYVGLEMLKDHPLVGIGLGNYKIEFLDYRAQFLNTARGENFGGFIPRAAQAHNEFVQFAAEIGILGILSILIGLGTLILNGFRRISFPEDRFTRVIGLSLIAGIFGFIVHATVSFPAHLPASSFAFVSFLGLLNSEQFGKSKYKLRPSGIYGYIAIALVAALLISVSVFAYRDWRANVLMGQGRQQMEYGNYYIAKEKLEKSLALDFQPRHIYYYLGVAERELGNEKKALDYFKKSEGQFEPYNLYLQLGTLYLGQDNLKKAKDYFEKFLSLGAKTSLEMEAKYFLATIAIREENVDRASEILKSILSKRPNFERALILQGDIANFQGNKKAARDKWQKALQVINKELKEVKRKLSRELPLDRIEELRSSKEKLEKRFKQVKENLAELDE